MTYSFNIYYSLIQYCPCRSRKEAVNIGIIIFNSSFKKTTIKMSDNNNRVCKFFGEDSFDSDWLSLAKDMTKNSLKYVSDIDSLKKIIETRANEIILTELVPILDKHCDVDSLFKELVND